jgi:hypothetical protein
MTSLGSDTEYYNYNEGKCQVLLFRKGRKVGVEANINNQSEIGII